MEELLIEPALSRFAQKARAATPAAKAPRVVRRAEAPDLEAPSAATTTLTLLSFLLPSFSSFKEYQTPCVYSFVDPATLPDTVLSVLMQPVNFLLEASGLVSVVSSEVLATASF